MRCALLIVCAAACADPVADDPDAEVVDAGGLGADAWVEEADARPDRGRDLAPDAGAVADGSSDQGSVPDAAPDGPRPPPSDGCGAAAPIGLQRVEMRHAGRARTYAVQVPATYDADVPQAVVIDLHGRTQSADAQDLLSGMRALAEREGFLAVQPTGGGSDSTWNAGVCCGAALTEGVDDVGFVGALLDDLAQRYCVDPDRVFATGMSNGGFMAHRLGCELADRVAAIAPVAGTLGVFDCQPARPVPTFHFHGTDDEIVPYDGFFGFASVEITIDAWVQANGCDADGQVYFAEADVRCERWSGCDRGADVQLCTIEGGGHTWPGGPAFQFLGDTTQTISASEEMWRFFSAHPRR